MLSGRQIRAARALLGWDAAELAKVTELTREAISRIETDLVKPQKQSLQKILRAFNSQGVEFLDNSGVRLKPHCVEVLEDREGFSRFYDSVYNHLENFGGSVCISGVDEKLFIKYRLDNEAHRRRMTDYVKKNPEISIRVLIEEGDTYPLNSLYAHYRWLPKKLFSKASFYVFGPYLALISFAHQTPPLIILINSPAFAEAYRQMFEISWANAIEPPKSKNKKSDGL